MKKVNRVLFLVVIAFLFISCAHEIPLPEGLVNIESHTEKTLDDSRSLVLYYSIENTGKLPINRSTVSFRAITAQETYYFTCVEAIRILPGKTAYLETEYEYHDKNENLVSDKLEILSCYFE